MISVLVYLIWSDRKNNWGNKIDLVCDKIENVDSKVDWVEEKLTDRIGTLEQKMVSAHVEIKQEESKILKNQTINIIKTGRGGRLSKVLRYYCEKMGCDHIFMGLFHNGTTDLRGLHYCKFDVIIDEFKNPLKLHYNDTDFQPLYKDENVMAYGDLPYQMTHIDAGVFNIENEELLDLSDTLYRRCKSRDIKNIGFACLYDTEMCVIGFIGCVNYTSSDIDITDMRDCAREIEKIYNKDV